MSDTFIIEIGSQAAGIVMRTPKGYRFFAAGHRFYALEGQLFRNAREAERAAIRLADRGAEASRLGPALGQARVTAPASRPSPKIRAA
jgi:hypothetical protein